MLKRKVYNQLLNWKATHHKECLLVKGARQIGKTYIIDCFGRANYKSYLYLNFVHNPDERDLFAGSLDADELLKAMTAKFRSFTVIPGDTLIFLDEIQNCPRARTAFKTFAQDGRVDVIASGSLLGLTYLNDGLNEERQHESIPVGYERQLTMHSLDFEEFLWAVGYEARSIDVLREAFTHCRAVNPSVNESFLQLFREYIAVGGMPEVVVRYTETKNFTAVYDTQMKIVNSNLDDIAKYATNIEKPKIRACYLSLPEQLARENKKFKYSTVEQGGSARKFGNAVDWLRESSLVLPCHNLSETFVPLNVYRNHAIFKLYLADVGILTAMMGFAVKNQILSNTLLGHAKGGIYENAIMSLLVRNGYQPFYYLPKSNVSEIDFLIENDRGVIPIEVKSGNDSSPSFDRLLARNDIALGYKFVHGNVGRSGKKITLPHYMTMFV